MVIAASPGVARAAAGRHVLGRLGFELQLQDEDQAFALQDEVRRFLAGPAQQVIERVFDAQSLPGQVLRLDRLEIDLGVVPAQADERHRLWSHRLAEQLQAALLAARWRQPAADTADASPARALPTARADLQLLGHWLRHGQLPWWAGAQVQQDLGRWLQQRLARPTAAVLQLLRQLGATPASQAGGDVLQRLAWQAPAGVLAALAGALLQQASAAPVARHWPSGPAWLPLLQQAWAPAARARSGGQRAAQSTPPPAAWARLLRRLLQAPPVLAHPAALLPTLRQLWRLDAGSARPASAPDGAAPPAEWPQSPPSPPSPTAPTAPSAPARPWAATSRPLVRLWRLLQQGGGLGDAFDEGVIGAPVVAPRAGGQGADDRQVIHRLNQRVSHEDAAHLLRQTSDTPDRQTGDPTAAHALPSQRLAAALAAALASDAPATRAWLAQACRQAAVCARLAQARPAAPVLALLRAWPGLPPPATQALAGWLGRRRSLPAWVAATGWPAAALRPVLLAESLSMLAWWPAGTPADADALLDALLRRLAASPAGALARHGAPDMAPAEDAHTRPEPAASPHPQDTPLADRAAWTLAQALAGALASPPTARAAARQTPPPPPIPDPHLAATVRRWQAGRGQAALRQRADALLAQGRLPDASQDWPALLQADAPWLRAALQRHGRVEAVREALAQRLDAPQLAAVVGLLVPGESAYITQVGHTLQRSAPTLALPAPVLGQAWRSLTLGYLLADRGSVFNRRSYLAWLLRQLARRHGLRSSRLLAALRQAVRAQALPAGLQGRLALMLDDLAAMAGAAGAAGADQALADAAGPQPHPAGAGAGGDAATGRSADARPEAPRPVGAQGPTAALSPAQHPRWAARLAPQDAPWLAALHAAGAACVPAAAGRFWPLWERLCAARQRPGATHPVSRQAIAQAWLGVLLHAGGPAIRQAPAWARLQALLGGLVWVDRPRSAGARRGAGAIAGPAWATDRAVAGTDPGAVAANGATTGRGTDHAAQHHRTRTPQGASTEWTTTLRALAARAVASALQARQDLPRWQALLADAGPLQQWALAQALADPVLAHRLGGAWPPQALAAWLAVLRPAEAAAVRAALPQLQCAGLPGPGGRVLAVPPHIAWRFVLHQLLVQGRPWPHDPAALATRWAAWCAGAGPGLPGRGLEPPSPAVVAAAASATGPAATAGALSDAPVLRPRQGPPTRRADTAAALADGLHLHNAGLVLLGPYIGRLMALLGLVQAGAFVDRAAAHQAVHLLQWLADGVAHGVAGDAAGASATDDVPLRLDHDEHTLALNKLLCGLPLDQPVPRQAWLGAAQRATGTQLLQAVIAHWQALGRTSVDGLRGSFLQREGRLRHEAAPASDALGEAPAGPPTAARGQWRLLVAPGPYDMLLDRLPWTLATLRLPWMPEVLHVDWR